MPAQETDFDVALSFAGEDRDYVDKVAHLLRAKGVNVFYDNFEEAELWGRDLYVYLTDVYRKRARFTVMFISQSYVKKLWTNHERRAAQARAFEESREYILPAKFDDTEVEGVLPTTGYISLTHRTPEEIAELVVKKLVRSGVSAPSAQVRRDFATVISAPAVDPVKFTVRLLDEQHGGISGATAFLQAENGTILKAVETDAGGYEFDVKVRRHYRLLAAHPDYPGVVHDVLDPAADLTITIPKQNGLGSVLIESSGYIPGLKGRLNPILDSVNRTYLYADNIAIDGGKNQPSTFSLGEEIELEDADGTVMLVVFKHIAARVSLAQFMFRRSRD